MAIPESKLIKPSPLPKNAGPPKPRWRFSHDPNWSEENPGSHILKQLIADVDKAKRPELVLHCNPLAHRMIHKEHIDSGRMFVTNGYDMIQEFNGIPIVPEDWKKPEPEPKA